MEASSRVVGSSSGSAPPQGVIRTAVAAANIVTGGVAGAVTTAAEEVGKLAFGALDWMKVKSETERNLTQTNNRLAGAALTPSTAQPPPNNPLMAALGPIAGIVPSLLSAFGAGPSNSNNPEDSDKKRPNPRDIAQNTPRDNKETKGNITKEPDNSSNSKDPAPKSSEEKAIGQVQPFGTENIT